MHLRLSHKRKLNLVFCRSVFLHETYEGYKPSEHIVSDVHNAAAERLTVYVDNHAVCLKRRHYVKHLGLYLVHKYHNNASHQC